MLDKLITVFCMIVVFGGFFYGVHRFTYGIDKASCYEQAELYKTEVIKYSYRKNYCFVEIDGRRANLDNYRVVGN